MLPLPHRPKDRRELLTALTDTLTQHPQLRDLWVILILGLNPRIEIPAKYITSWTWVLAEHAPLYDPVARFEAFRTWLMRAEPAWTPVVVSSEGTLWLMETAEQCAQGRHHDPCRPSALPFRGYFRSCEEFKAEMIPIIRAVAAVKYPSVPTVAAFLRSAKHWHTTDESMRRMIYRWCAEFKIHWPVLRDEALAVNPPLHVSPS